MNESREREEGLVKWFDNNKGFGFILSPKEEDVFVHYRSIEGKGYKTLLEGEKVSYLQIRTDKGWSAAEVCRLNAPIDNDTEAHY